MFYCILCYFVALIVIVLSFSFVYFSQPIYGIFLLKAIGDRTQVMLRGLEMFFYVEHEHCYMPILRSIWS